MHAISARMNSMRENDIHSLIEWYKENKRSLPWRDTGNPYDVWLSEIMLQQTRIEAVKPKYLSFKEALPTIQDLAQCSDDRLMRLWEGLGYYSRARNLKKCANVLVDQYNGKLPNDYHALLNLPGIGPYTAGAIASIAFDIPVSAIDGNVLRVLARYYGIQDDIRNPKVRNILEDKLHNFYTNKDKHYDYSSFNQGIMELGETVCVPNGTPQCHKCPLKENCYACIHDVTQSIPYRSALKKRKIVERTLFIIRDNQSFVVHKRPSSGLLAGLYEFIGIDKHLNQSSAIQYVESLGFTPLKIQVLPESVHIFTHLEWHMHAYEIKVAQIQQLDQDFYSVTKKELQSLAIPSAFKKYIDWYSLRD